MEEDQTIEMHRDEETRDFILSGMGQQHIEIIVEKLKRKYSAEVVLKAPKVPYKETIRGQRQRPRAIEKTNRRTGAVGRYLDQSRAASPARASNLSIRSSAARFREIIFPPSRKGSGKRWPEGLSPDIRWWTCA